MPTDSQHLAPAAPPPPKKITVVLTARPPVRIDPEEWGTIADAKWHSGEHECQANETAYIRVRQHDDGRTLVYGVLTSGPGGMPLGYTGRSAGYLVSGDATAIVGAIRLVGDELVDPEFPSDYGSLAARCIADLPPEEI